MDTILDQSKVFNNNPEKMLNYLLNMNQVEEDIDVLIFEATIIVNDAKSAYEEWKSLSPDQRWQLYRDQFVKETEQFSAKNKGTYKLYKKARAELFAK
jgi:hypothetical protein